MEAAQEKTLTHVADIETFDRLRKAFNAKR